MDSVDPEPISTTLPVLPVAGRPTEPTAQPHPAAPAPVKIVRAAPAKAAPGVSTSSQAETVPVAPEAAARAPEDKRDDREVASNCKDEGDDPLADAIASGATAVLALAPTIVAPVAPAPVPAAPAEQPVRAGASAAARPLKLATRAPSPDTPTTQSAPGPTEPSGEQAPAVLPDTNSRQADADADTRRQPAPASDAKPALTQLPPEVAKAVTAALKRNEASPLAQQDTAPLTAASMDPSSSLARPTAAAKSPADQSPQPAVRQAQQQPVQPQSPPPARRRSDEAPAPRRAGETRRRVDPMLTDAAPAAQPASETPRTGFALAAGAGSKGDAIVEQTLTIAKDGAWLDRLAKDIAGAGSGNDLHFKLNPENLGALSVAISQKDDGASIRLTADNQATRDILVDAQPKLIAEARAQGLKVSDTQVDVRQEDRQSQNQNQGNSQDNQRWAQSQNGHAGQHAQTGHNGQNRQSSPEHKPFVSNLGRKAEAESESPGRDSDALYA